MGKGWDDESTWINQDETRYIAVLKSPPDILVTGIVSGLSIVQMGTDDADIQAHCIDLNTL